MESIIAIIKKIVIQDFLIHLSVFLFFFCLHTKQGDVITAYYITFIATK